MEWNEENIMNLIEQYHRYPNLWNAKDKNYKKRNMKKDSIQEISLALNVTPEETERKLSVILAQYRRARAKALRMKKSGMGTDEIEGEVWFGFKYLSFLNDKYEPNSDARESSKKTETEAESTEQESSDVSYEESETTTIVDKMDSQNLELDETGNICSTPTMKQFKSPKKIKYNKSIQKKNKKSNGDDVQLNHAYDMLTQVAEKRSHKNKDEYSLFAEHMAAKLRKFDPISRAYVEQKIYQIISDTEMRILLSQQEGNNQNIHNIMPSSPATPMSSTDLSVIEIQTPSPQSENDNMSIMNFF